jgi:hypothetical protein
MQITRYPGVTSFPDTEIAQRLFFGRKEDSRKLFYCIAGDYLTLLYSKSGYGKTSLLQAGVFGMLREENYFPISARFNKREFNPQEIIRSEILNIHNQNGFEVVSATKDKELPVFFQNLEIWSPFDKLLTPVIVLDQFEELFTLEHNFNHRSSFINELSEVLNKVKEGHVSIKFVISIREDFIGHLEKLAVKIPSIFTNRFRLEALSKNAAKEAIIQPAKIQIENVTFDSPEMDFSEEAMEELLRFLSLKMVEGKWIETNEIEPIQLQILCSELEERAILARQRNQVDQYKINKTDLGGFEGMSGILGTFYDKQMKKVSEVMKLNPIELRAVREILEKDLIVGKRRVPLAYESIINTENVRKDAIDLLISNKLLKIENYQQNALVEISHDALVEPILISYQIREAEEKRKRDEEELTKARTEILAKKKQIRAKNIAIGFLIFSVIAGLAWFYLAYISADKYKQDWIQKNEALTLLYNQIKEQRDSIKNIKDSVQVTYITSRGKANTGNKGEFAERVSADSSLKVILSNPGNRLNTGLKIQYFQKSLDDTKIEVAIKELGYDNFRYITSNVNLAGSKTNGIFYGADVKLLDLQVIALTLIRAGFKLQRVADIPRSSTIQIISRNYRANEKPPRPLTVQNILKAKACAELNVGYKYE